MYELGLILYKEEVMVMKQASTLKSYIFLLLHSHSLILSHSFFALLCFLPSDTFCSFLKVLHFPSIREHMRKLLMDMMEKERKGELVDRLVCPERKRVVLTSCQLDLFRVLSFVTIDSILVYIFVTVVAYLS